MQRSHTSRRDCIIPVHNTGKVSAHTCVCLSVTPSTLRRTVPVCILLSMSKVLCMYVHTDVRNTGHKSECTFVCTCVRTVGIHIMCMHIRIYEATTHLRTYVQYRHTNTHTNTHTHTHAQTYTHAYISRYNIIYIILHIISRYYIYIYHI